MFDRFTDRARITMGLARQESRRLRHGYIGPEHMLLGLLKTDGAGAAALEGLGVEEKRLRARLVARITPGRTTSALRQLPFTAEAKRVLEIMEEEAGRLGHDHLGTEHLLLGLVGERQNVAGEVLREMGVTSERARAQVLGALGEAMPELLANLEVKAACADLARAREAALGLGAIDKDKLRQEDTYYRARSGRLKLRRADDRAAELIWYHRSNAAEARRSDYEVVPVPDPEALDRVLRGALGVARVVRKSRELLLWQNVRIHLDAVEDLGTYVELEAVLGPDADEETSRQRLDRVCEVLRIREDDLIGLSYSDL